MRNIDTSEGHAIRGVTSCSLISDHSFNVCVLKFSKHVKEQSLQECEALMVSVRLSEGLGLPEKTRNIWDDNIKILQS
jgi:hypothetical protein